MCVSKTTKKDILRYIPFLKNEQIYVTYNGIDIDKFSPHLNNSLLKNVLLKKYDIIVNNKFIILIPGRIDFLKGQDLVIMAFNKLPKYIQKKTQLMIVGDIADKNYFRSLHARAKDNITFITNPKDIAPYYTLADLFVVPTRFFEGFCLVAAEALASGTPVIATDQPAIREVCGEFCIYTTPLKYDGIYHLDPNDIASKIIYLYKNEELRNTIKVKGRKMIKKRFRNDIIMKKLELIYSKISSNKICAHSFIHRSFETLNSRARKIITEKISLYLLSNLIRKFSSLINAIYTPFARVVEVNKILFFVI